MNYYLLFFTFLCSFKMALSMRISLPDEAYQLCVNLYLDELKDIKHPKCELNKVDLVNYLQNRADTAEELLAVIGKSNYNEASRDEYEKLDPQKVMLYSCSILPVPTGHPIQNNPNARAKYLFAYTAQQLSASLVRKKLGCYIDTLREFEKSFNPPLQQVSADEFNEQLKHNISDKEFHTFKLQSSRDFAKALLSKLN